MPPQSVIALSDQFTGEFALIDQNGELRRDEDFEGRLMLIYFGYTFCPDVCPGDVNVISAALNELGERADEIAPIFISVDPERDRPETLKDYFAFDERIVALTGDDAAAEAARASFKQVAQITELPESAIGYTVNHMRFFYVTDRAGRPIYAVQGGVSPQELAGFLQRMIREHPGG